MNYEEIEDFALQPFGDRLFIKPDPIRTERTTASGLVIQTPAGEKAVTGTIVAIGPIVKSDYTYLYPTQRVVYSEFAGYIVSFKGETYLLCTPHEVFCEIPSGLNIDAA
jgi:co-chaperonin GroES (HSP10)